MPIIASDTTTEIVEKVSGAVVIIKAFSEDDDMSQGSGVLIDDGKRRAAHLPRITTEAFAQAANKACLARAEFTMEQDDIVCKQC